MKSFDLEDRIQIRGKGEPLLLAHGGGGPKTWDLMLEPLAEHFQVIVPAFPGFHHQDGLIQYSDQLYTDFAESLRKSLAIEKWSIIGTSLGGRTVLNYAVAHEERVAHMVVIDPVGLNYISPIFRVPGFSKICPPLLSLVFSSPDKVAALGAKDAVDRSSPAIAQAHAWFCEMIADPVVHTNYFRIVAGIAAKKKEWNEQLPKLNTPTLILWASDDVVCPVRGAHKLALLIRNSKISILDGYRHLAILERPDFFVDEITRFLNCEMD